MNYFQYKNNIYDFFENVEGTSEIVVKEVFQNV